MNKIESTMVSSPLFTSPDKLQKLTPESLKTVNIIGYSLDDFKTINPTGYTILNQVGQTTNGLNYFPASSKIVLDSGQMSSLRYNFQNFEKDFLPNLARELGVNQSMALEKTQDFLGKNQIIVQPTGIQGRIYNTMWYGQQTMAMTSVANKVSTLKLMGETGVQIIQGSPMVFVGATYLGSIFFGYCGAVAGNNTIGLVCNVTSATLAYPMKGVEIVLNNLILTPISNVVGLPLMINGTDTVLQGKGISVQNYLQIAASFERITNSTAVRKIRKIHSVLRAKDI